ncbi:pantetheine-phosphate adenylyltransferase [Vogesella sp. DC21W]|jgi:pantetheine-phosphate adenylyltransferase|uniref:Phosphopantetheine adenylyltransferase n=1 Tax=Vogesella aquatica TaxID=2984206 RepID=A0ABT5IWZ7_9NEIS|nr:MULTISPECIES: pantetheine-phosphate adenylyltransferase [Vogesella]MDC7717058.1 pantetheine-phosphate adenylyltransferase [Vogesella aquatica]
MPHTHKGKRQLKRAVYAGSFDPVTNGHLWMIREAVDLFDELVVAIGVNPEKRCTFDVEERLDMLRAVTRGFSKLKVEVFENQFLVNYAQSIDANYIVRGIRTATDYEYERTMRYINSDLHADITTIFLLPPREYAEVSSTMVKGLMGPAGWEQMIRQYVPEPVYRKLVNYYQQQG